MATATLETINSTLVGIKSDSKSMLKFMTSKKTSAANAREGLKPRATVAKPAAIAKPATGGKKNLFGIGDLLKGVFGKLFDWGKWFAIIGLGALFWDEIKGFLKGAFGGMADWVAQWWESDFLPGLQKLSKVILGEEFYSWLFGDSETGEKGIFTKAWNVADEWAGVIGQKFTEWGTSFDNWTKEMFGFSIADTLLGERKQVEGFDEDGKSTGMEAPGKGTGEREGGAFSAVANYFDNVGKGIIQFGMDIGVLDSNGDLSLGAGVGLVAISSGILAIVGPGAIFAALGTAIKGVTSGLLKLGIGAVKLPFTALSTAITGTIKAVKGVAAKITGLKTPTTTPVKTPTPPPKVPAGQKVVGMDKHGRDVVERQTKTGKTMRVVASGQPGGGQTTRVTQSVPKGTMTKPPAANTPPAAKPGGGAAKPGGGAAVSKPVSQAQKITKAISKYPKVQFAMKFAKRIPLLGSLISAGLIGVTLADETLSPKEKTGKIAGALGGIGGATMGGFLGALGGGLAGAAGGPLALVSAAIGGLGGAVVGGLMGDSLFHGIAQYMLGSKVTAFPSIFNPFGPNYDTNSLFNQKTPAASSVKKPAAVTSMNGQVVGKGATGNAPGGAGSPSAGNSNVMTGGGSGAAEGAEGVGADAGPGAPASPAGSLHIAGDISTLGGSDPRRETVDSAAVKQTSHTAVNQNVDNSTNVVQAPSPPPAPPPAPVVIVKLPGPPVPNLNGKIAYAT